MKLSFLSLLILLCMSQKCPKNNFNNNNQINRYGNGNLGTLSSHERRSISQGDITKLVSFAGIPPGADSWCGESRLVESRNYTSDGDLLPDGELEPKIPFKDEFKLDYVGDFPKPSCESIGIPKSRSCFLPPSSPSLRNSIILDPGHSDAELGRRSGGHSIIHEGEMNMTTSLLIKDMLHRCYAAPMDAVKLTRWPGEKVFGEYSNQSLGDIKAELGKEGGARQRYVNKLINQDSKSVFVSVHHNAFNKKAEHSLAIYNGSDEATRSIASLMAQETKGAIAKHFNASNRKNKVERHSRPLKVASGTYGVINPNRVNARVPRILMENFFMDGEQARKINSSNVKRFHLSKTIYGEDGKIASVEKINPEYKVADINVSAAIGNLRGLLKAHACPERNI